MTRIIKSVGIGQQWAVLPRGGFTMFEHLLLCRLPDVDDCQTLKMMIGDFLKSVRCRPGG
ncbi:MAG: hypothetical protein U0936_27765 [Planctomycetaceae bacterium]